MRRNPYYGGTRKVHLDGFEVDLRGGTPQEMIRRVDRSEADWGHTVAAPFFTDPTLDLVAKYGVNKSQFFVKPGLTLRMLAFNASRDLFHNNPKLRQAVNFALDRQALLARAVVRSQAADRSVPPARHPGVQGRRRLPARRPNLAMAKALARGTSRSARRPLHDRRRAGHRVGAAREAAARRDRSRGRRQADPLHIASAAYLEKLAARGEGWDLALVLWTPNVPDPARVSQPAARDAVPRRRTLTRFRRVPRAASWAGPPARRRGLRGVTRTRSWMRCSPGRRSVASLGVFNEVTLVSSRVGCIVLRPVLDLAVACLKE